MRRGMIEGITSTPTHIIHLIHQYFAIGSLASDVGITKCSIQ